MESGVLWRLWGSHMISYGVIEYGIELGWSILEEYCRLEEKYGWVYDISRNFELEFCAL